MAPSEETICTPTLLDRETLDALREWVAGERDYLMHPRIVARVAAVKRLRAFTELASMTAAFVAAMQEAVQCDASRTATNLSALTRTRHATAGGSLPAATGMN